MGGEVVSTIDGHPITLTEVERAARSAGVPLRLALARLQDEMLLAHAAARAGYVEDSEIRGGGRRAMVQALLRLEFEAEPVEVSDEVLAAAYDENPGAFEAPELRSSVHVLARVDGPPAAADEAERYIRAVHRRLPVGPEAEAELLAMQRRPPEHLPFTVEVEEVSAMRRNGDADEAYSEGLFTVDAPGLVPDIVRSSYGWHVIVCTRIEPARSTSREEAIEILRGRFVAATRARRLLALQSELHERIGSRVDMSTVHRYLDDTSLWERGR